MKSKIKLKKFLSSGLSIVMVSSAMSVPQNLTLASQLADIKIVEDNQSSDSGNEIVNQETSESNNNVSNEETSENNDNTLNEETSESNDNVSNEETSENNDNTLNEETSESNDNVLNEQINDINNSILSQENTQSINETKNENIQIKDAILDGIIIEDGVITGYNGSSAAIGELNIPREVKGEVVTAIGDKAFINKGVTKLTFDDDSEIKSIGVSAFENNPIVEIKFPQSMTTIEKSAFSKCDKLVTLNTVNITNIGLFAFENCTSLISVELPNVKEAISLFYGCSSIESAKLLKATKVSDRFSSNLTSIEIPEAKTIGEQTFSGCNKLTSIDLPKVESIESLAFMNCTSLTSITIPNLTSTGIQAFYGCTGLTSITMPNLTSIGEKAFYKCTSLTSIELPKVITIGDYAFYECTNLVSITIPNLESIENNNVFTKCNALKEIKISNKNREDVKGSQNAP